MLRRSYTVSPVDLTFLHDHNRRRLVLLIYSLAFLIAVTRAHRPMFYVVLGLSPCGQLSLFFFVFESPFLFLPLSLKSELVGEPSSNLEIHAEQELETVQKHAEEPGTLVHDHRPRKIYRKFMMHRDRGKTGLASHLLSVSRTLR